MLIPEQLWNNSYHEQHLLGCSHFARPSPVLLWTDSDNASCFYLSLPSPHIPLQSQPHKPVASADRWNTKSEFYPAPVNTYLLPIVSLGNLPSITDGTEQEINQIM